MNIVQPPIVMVPSFLTHIRIFVARCHAENHNVPMVVVIEDLLKLVNCRYRDDSVGLGSF
jgi:hypothetical protein